MASTTTPTALVRALIVAVGILGAVIAGAGCDACAPAVPFYACDDSDDCRDTERCAAGLCVPAAAPGGEGEGEPAGEGEGEGDAGEGEGEGDVDPGCPGVAGAAVVARFEDHCYAGFDDVVTWGRAVARCGALGGHLAIPSSDAEQAFLVQLATQSLPAADPLLGLVDAHDEGAFATLTGEPVLDPPPFHAGQPDNKFTTDDCMQLLDRPLDPGFLWNDIGCNVALDDPTLLGIRTTPLCELPLGQSAAPLVPGAFCGDGVVQPGLGEDCDDGDNDNSGSCPAGCNDGGGAGADVAVAVAGGRTFVAFARERTWQESRAVCNAIDGHLAMPDAAAVDDVVEELKDRIGATAVWIGFNDLLAEADDQAAQFRRVDDGQEIGVDGFTDFAPGEPNAFNNAEDCVAMLDNGEWNDTGCDGAESFVCELADVP